MLDHDVTAHTTGLQPLPPRDFPSPSSPSSSREGLTVKQQREASRADKVAILRKRQAAEKRNRTIGIGLASAAALAVVVLVITLVVTSGTPAAKTKNTAIEGLQTYTDLTNNHVTTKVDYEQSPPVGGDHAAAWLNCGIYTEPVPTENAVHDLEHGAVWITYNPDDVKGNDLKTLQDSAPSTYATMSPWPDLQSPVVISAWGAQVELTGVDDPRLQQFVDKYWQSPDALEPGASCVGGVDAPGKIA